MSILSTVLICIATLLLLVAALFWQAYSESGECWVRTRGGEYRNGYNDKAALWLGWCLFLASVVIFATSVSIQVRLQNHAAHKAHQQVTTAWATVLPPGAKYRASDGATVFFDLGGKECSGPYVDNTVGPNYEEYPDALGAWSCSG